MEPLNFSSVCISGFQPGFRHIFIGYTEKTIQNVPSIYNFRELHTLRHQKLNSPFLKALLYKKTLAKKR